MKKIIALLLVVALTASISIAGTMAYLQDEDSDVNVMTVGNVYIDQIEQERDENGNLVNFTQAKPAFPAVGDTALTDSVSVNGADYAICGDGLKNAIDKIITVKNTGVSSAYVRTLVAIEAPGATRELIHYNYNANGITVSTPIDATINGTEYMVLCFTYQAPLAPGMTTAPSLLQVFLDSAAENEDCEAFGKTWDILSLSQAVQTAGFEPPAVNTFSNDVTYGADYALDTAYGVKNHPNVVEWFEGIDVPEVVDNSSDLLWLIGDGDSVVLSNDITVDSYIYVGANGTSRIDLNGKNLTFDMPEGTLMKQTGFVAVGTSLVLDGEGTVNMQKNPGSNCNLIWTSDNGHVTINNGTYLLGECDQKYHMYVQNGSKVVINGGEFITNDPGAAIAYCINAQIEINGGFFQNTANPGKALLDMGNNKAYKDNQKITLSGGTFVNWNPMDSAFARPWPESGMPALIVLAEGYEVISQTQSNGDVWYSVVRK